MTDLDRDPSDSLTAQNSLYIPSNQRLSVSHSEPCQAARARLRLRSLTSPNGHARALGAVQVATIRRIGTPTAR